MKKLLKGGKVYTGGAFVRVDVLVEDGVVAGVGDLSVSCLLYTSDAADE